MTEKKSPADETGTDSDRRDALIKIGKYAAYTAPAMMVTVGTARAGTPAPTSTPRG
jgi:hypothetical protein